MKYRILLCVCFIVSGLVCCRKDNSYNYESVGTITGLDARMCPSPCCGGWFIQIDSVTYEFDSLPDNANINLTKETLPLAVKLDWQLLNVAGCPDKRIIIQKIAKE